jgi:hypothetical protein
MRCAGAWGCSDPGQGFRFGLKDDGTRMSLPHHQPHRSAAVACNLEASPAPPLLAKRYKSQVQSGRVETIILLLDAIFGLAEIVLNTNVSISRCLFAHRFAHNFGDTEQSQQRHRRELITFPYNRGSGRELPLIAVHLSWIH